MNSDEVGKLLGLMALADNRKPPEDEEGQVAMIEFWLGMVGDLDYGDAAKAVQEHYQASRDWIMPADIRKRVRALRAERLAHSLPPPPPADMADRPVKGQYARAVLAAVQRIADGGQLPPEIAGPLPGDPPPDWQQAREAMKAAETVRPDPQQIAREQAEESRRERLAREAAEGSRTP